MPLEFKLPDIGEGTVEGEIVRWIAKPGDRVKADDPVVEVMTDKATVVLTAPKAGTIREIRAEPGTVAKVGSVIYLMDIEGEGGAAKGAAAPAAKPVEAAAAAPAAATPSAATVARAAPPGDGERGTAAAAPSAPTGERKPLAAPATRKLARELGVDLASVTPSGPNGRITEDDVRRAAGGAAAPAPRSRLAEIEEPALPRLAAPAAAPHAAAPPAAGEEVERVPLRGIRKAIAAAMTRSKFTATHYTYVEEVDMSEIVRLREREKPRAEKAGVKLTYLPFIIKAAIAGLRKFPMLNAELDEKNQEILLKKYYHIGLSVQTDAGLLVPVIRNADRRSAFDLAREIDRLTQAARAQKLAPQELKGSTFTITSAGNIGGVLATPIINFPEVAILGVNQIKKRPVVRTGAGGGDEIVIRHMMFLSISLDHRIVDGAVAAHFMNEVTACLEDPVRLVLEG